MQLRYLAPIWSQWGIKPITSHSANWTILGIVGLYSVINYMGPINLCTTGLSWKTGSSQLVKQLSISYEKLLGARWNMYLF